MAHFFKKTMTNVFLNSHFGRRVDLPMHISYYGLDPRTGAKNSMKNGHWTEQNCIVPHTKNILDVHIFPLDSIYA